MKSNVPIYYLGYAAAGGLLLGLALANFGLGSSDTPVVNMNHEMDMVSDMSMAMGETSDMTHGHEPYPVTQGPIPEISLRAKLDPESGWNLEIMTENFEFRPAQFGAQSSANAGHAHLYINDVKIGRLYGPFVHLNNLSLGMNEIRVSLNTDDHKTLFVDGKRVEATIQLAN